MGLIVEFDKTSSKSSFCFSFVHSVDKTKADQYPSP